ncbi:F-box DNA helicase 1-like [Tigriopus californicus]|uniref:F-box DNA helicase 1-like n=1 Tax=Tigriopus californicus TaxID=6832 RepID=UPI0027DAA8D3|nr:F-box DNA helicase 1-like [Tigriopus californicus]
MQHLPNEILELIFVHLSIEDLLLSVALVCTKWRDLVQNVHVLPWKKACHRFIRRLPPENHSSTPLEAFSDVINNPLSIKQYTFANKEVNPDVVVNKTIYTLFMDPNQVLHLELALPWLVTYLSARFTLSHHQTLQLQRHSKYSLVKAVIFERFPEWWDEREDVAKGVPAAVLLSVIAYRPQHVREIIDHLLETSLRKNSENLDGPSNSPVVVLELMHAIAFGLSFFLERSDGNPVFSYNVLTALNEYEQNRDVVIPDALQLLKSPLSEQFVLGPDQARVVNHVFSSSSDVVAVEGFPGTGKTLAVANMCQVNQDRKFLVLCYSHSVRNHLLKIYPSKNVVIQSLIEFVASRGHAFSNDKIVTSFGPNDVFLCDLLDCFGESREVVSMAVYKTILFFVYSELTDLAMEAVEKGCVDLNIWASWYGQILSAARKIWSAIIDPEYMKLGIPLVAMMKILKNDPNATDLKQTTLIVENLCDLTPHIFQYFKAQFNHVVLMNEKVECINHRGENLPICFTHTYRLVQNHRNGHHIGSLLDQVFRMKPRQQKAMKIGSRTDDEVSSFLNLRNSRDGETVVVISETEEDLVDFLLSLDLELNSEYFGTFLHPLSKRFFDKYEAISTQLAKHAIISKFEDCIEGSYLLEDDSFLHRQTIKPA